MRRVAMCVVCLGAIAWWAVSPAVAQDRKAKIVNDREAFKDSDLWTYNNLDEGIAQAKKTGKPLLAVLRCIP
ncbi:MAG: hypothetical protein HZA46_06395 [Planctomycetales bacterium]|nr:hypothetical protein [Planctomycetales bacterium]